VSSICAEYGIAKQSVSDIIKAKSDIRNFVLKFNADVGDTTQPTIKVSEVKDHLNFVIQYVEQSAIENVYAYYEHLQHLHQLLTEEIRSKQTQQKINYFFIAINVSNQHEPGPSCSED
jgi:hypothetical protein